MCEIFHLGVRLQEQLRSKIKELVKLRTQHAKKWERWTEKYLDFRRNNQSIQNIDQSIFSLLQDSEKTNQYQIEEYGQSIQQLTDIYKSIPKRQCRILKSRLDTEHANVKKINRRLTNLKVEQTELETKNGRVESTLTSRTLDQTRESKLQRKQQDLSTKLTNINRDIKRESHLYDQATESYENSSNLILIDSLQDERAQLQSMRTVLRDFTEVLKSPSFSTRTTTRLATNQHPPSSSESETDDDDKDCGERV